MKKTIARVLVCGFVAVTISVSSADSNDEIAKRILEVYPQADTNGDGLLSPPERAAVNRIALKRYPQADADNDGKLSVAEQEALLQKIAKPESRHSANEVPAPVQMAPTASVENRSAITESSVRQGPRPVKPAAHGIGRQVPDMSFTDIAGCQHKLSDFADQEAVVFAMTGTGCPLCLKYSPSLAAIEQQYRDRNVVFVFVNPNESEGEQRIREAVKQHGFQGHYVSDGAMRLPAALGAETTTEVFVVDRARTLVYRGAFDDQYGFGYSLSEPRNNYLTDALDAVLAGSTPSIQATTSPGCQLFYGKSDVPDSDTPDTTTAITYHNRVSRIIQANCIECHRNDGIAPIAFETYGEVKDYANMIGNVVDRGIMPPWFAAPQTTVARLSESSSSRPDSESQATVNEPSSLHWSNDRSLSAREKIDLFAWIKSGAPEGDPADAPLPKSFPGGWLIGKPDAVFEFPRPIPVKATGIMPYKNVTVETELSEDRWVQAIEVRPGQLDVVHHVIVSLRTDGEDVDERDGYWGAYVPGNSTLVYPDGYARLLPKGAKLRFQMHYTPNGTATEDSTRIGVVYAKQPPRHEVKVAGIANGNIRIPAHASNHEEFATLRLPFDVQVLSFLPHMHLRGKAARYEAVTAAGTETLLDIPHYDFNWQLLYQLAEPKMLRQGDTIRFTGWFDNSENNPANPDPNKTVRWGQQTEDEMHLGYVEYIVPGAKLGQSLTGLKAGRSGSARIDGRVDGEVRIGGKGVNVSELIGAIRQLDRNQDGDLFLAEVPVKHRRLFNLLDANDDQVLTVDEARETIRKYQDR